MPGASAGMKLRGLVGRQVSGSVPSFPTIDRRGYTGHEHLDNLELIHMNGRVYDPAIGRFLSPDPFIPDPFDPQSLNRYSYVRNNPMSRTDPSGFFDRCPDCGPPGLPPPRFPNPIVVGGGPSLSFGWAGPSAVGVASPGVAPSELRPDFARFDDFVERQLDPASVIAASLGPYSSGSRPPSSSSSCAPMATPGINPVGGSCGSSGPNVWDFLLNSSTHIALSYGEDSWSFAFWSVFAGGWTDTAREASEGNYSSAAFELGTAIFKPARAVRRLDCCFVEGTLVMTAEGLRPIEEIEVGDLVLARNAQTGETAYKPVTGVIRRHDRVIWEIQLEVFLADGTTGLAFFETTDDHPWRTVDDAWTETRALSPGMQIQRASGSEASVISVVETARIAQTYNLEVAEFESYFVGDQQVWVHNCRTRVPGNARTTSDPREIYRRLEENHGIDRYTASDRLHEIKRHARIANDDDLIFDMTGNVYDRNGRWLGSLTEGGAK